MSKPHILITGAGSSARLILSSLAVRATAAPVAVPRDKDAAVTCRDAGVELVMAADQKWEVDVPTKFQWMPGGVSLVTPSYGGRTIRMAVLCDESTARAVQASFDRWRKTMPKQRPFGCVEHREQEAAFLPTHFEWDTERNGVACCGTPTALGAQNVNGRIHRSWSPTFTTDADYESCRCSDCGLGWDGCDAARCEGVMEFPDGVRGSLQNPAQVTGVAFSVGSLTNKPAFRNIDPVRARDGSGSGTVTASGTSEGVRKSWAKRRAEAWNATVAAGELSSKAHAGTASHLDAAEAHKKAAAIHLELGSLHEEGSREFELHDSQARAHEKAAEQHQHEDVQSRGLSDTHRRANNAYKDSHSGKGPMALPSYKASDTTNAEEVVKSSTGTVRATWSDAAREAAAAARAHGWNHEGSYDGGKVNVYHKVHDTRFGQVHRVIVDDGEPSAGDPKGYTSKEEAMKHAEKYIADAGYKKDANKATDPTLRAHCKDNLYADVPDATEAEAAAYDACVDGGGSHQQAVAELRKKRNPATATVQTSDAILAKLAQEQPPVRARTSDEILGAKPVKATWSDAAREAAALARKREGGGLLRRKHEQARRDHLEEVEQAGKDYANAGTEDEMDATHKTRVAHLASAKAYETGSEVHHYAASLAHLAAKQAMDKVNDEGMGRGHLAHAQVHDALAHNETTHNWVTASLGADKGSVRAHCKGNSDEILSRLAAGRTGRTAA